MTDTTREIISKLFIEHSMHTNQALISDLVVLVDQAITEARAEEKQLSYNEGVEDARLAVCSVEKNTWEKYVYLRIDKIFELLKPLTKKDSLD